MADVETGPRAFSRFFEKLGYGAAEADASRELYELGRTLREHNLDRGEAIKGKLAIEISFAMDSDGVMKVGYAVKRTDPKRTTPGSICWVDRNGNVTYQDPKQTELEFGVHEVPNPSRETVAVREQREQGGA